jgi:hypothetical protein
VFLSLGRIIYDNDNDVFMTISWVSMKVFTHINMYVASFPVSLKNYKSFPGQ